MKNFFSMAKRQSAGSSSTVFRRQPSLWRLCGLALLCASAVYVAAFPPAPFHVLYGQIRDEYGNPLSISNGEVFLESANTAVVSGRISSNLPPGTNYRLAIPMDAGLLEDAYRPSALNPAVPFKLKVKIGAKIYVPIEMKGDYSKLGQPSQRTRIDLTLGEDSDNDGLPDAWEKTMLSMLGGNKSLADINANDDTDGDGLSNLKEYLAGTYAFDPKDGFALSIQRSNSPDPILEFTALRGRTYSIHGSDDLKTWSPVSFIVKGAASASKPQESYKATDVRVLEVTVPASPNGPTPKFFKLMAE